MPVLTYHLVEGQYSAEQQEGLLLESSRFFAEVLRCPVDRVRVFISLYRPGLVAAGGRICSEEGPRAPFFSFYLLEGRSLEDRHRLLAGFTDIAVDVLKVDRSLVRGAVVSVNPENWAIAGEPASVKRAEEIRSRAEATGK